MTHISGGCLCGQVRYEGDTEIKGIINCHCDDCRKASGAPYLINVFVVEADLTFKGETMEYQHKSDRGTDMTKLNCANCGSPVFGRNSAREGIAVIRAGTIDQKDLITPKITVFAESKIPSTPMDVENKSFARMPS